VDVGQQEAGAAPPPPSPAAAGFDSRLAPLQIPMMVDTLAKLVAADKLRLDTVEYELSTEFKEALEHALEGGRNAKVLLLSGDCGVFYQ